MEEVGQRLDGAHGRGGGEAAQVHIQLPVREVGADLVGPVDGQGGLAHPGRAPDGRDHHRGRCPRAGGQQPVEAGQTVGPAGEAGHVHRQLTADPANRRHGREAAGSLDGGGEASPLLLGQAQGIGQPPQCVAARVMNLAGLQAGDGAHADPGAIGQLFLG
jgi:hypothetical protein